jgi:hypothetical protein
VNNKQEKDADRQLTPAPRRHQAPVQCLLWMMMMIIRSFNYFIIVWAFCGNAARMGKDLHFCNLCKNPILQE